MLPESEEPSEGSLRVQVYLCAPDGAAGAPSASHWLELDPTVPKYVGIACPEEWVTEAAREVRAKWGVSRPVPAGGAAAETATVRWSRWRQLVFPSFKQTERALQERGAAETSTPEATGSIWRMQERLVKDKDRAQEAQKRAHARSVELSRQVGRLTEEVEALRARQPPEDQDALQAAQQRADALEIRLSQTNASLAALRSEAESMAAERKARSAARELAITEAEDKLQVTQAEAGVLRVRVRELEAALSESEETLAGLRREQASMRAQIETLTHDSGRAAESAARALSEQSSEPALRFQVSQLEDDAAQLRRLLASANEGAATALQRESEAQAANLEMRSSWLAARQRFQDELASMKRAKDELSARLDAVQEQARAESAAAAGGASAASLSHDLGWTKERLRVANATIDDLRRAACRAEAEAVKRMEAIDCLTARLVAADEAAPRRAPVADTAGDSAIARDADELEKLRPRVQSLVNERDALSRTLQSVRATLSVVRQTSAERTDELTARLLLAEEALGPQEVARLHRAGPAEPHAQAAAVPPPPPPPPQGNRAAFAEAAALEREAEERLRAEGAP